MKHISIKIKHMLMAALMLTAFYGCYEKNEDFMGINIKDFNSNIQSVDKTVAQPGDTVTITGTNLDKVYKIMLNEDNVPVVFKATPTQIKMAVPGTSPLGDVIRINIFFSGKGLAVRTIKIISPPVIMSLLPSAAQSGDMITIQGKELYLAQTVKIGDADVTSSLQIIDDTQIRVKVPDNFTGGKISIITASGGISQSPDSLFKGTDIMINNFDGVKNYFGSISSNGNLDLDVEETGLFPQSKYWTFTFKDNATSWGGNIDFYTSGMPTYTDNTIISLSVDIKLSKAMSVNVMIARGSDVWGKTLSLKTGWQTVVLKFPDMGSGYGSTPSTDPGFMPLPAFKDISGVKIQPPAQASSGNFGETISVDNIRFIIKN